MTTAKVTKFKEYPTDEPNSYAVGFNITTDNGRQFYRDIAIPFEDVVDMSNEEIKTFAYQRLRPAIENQIDIEMAKNSIIGSEVDLESLPPMETPQDPDEVNNL
jgi:hypothetical protein